MGVKELPVMLLVMMLAFFRADPPSHAPVSSSSSSSKNSSSNNSSGQPRKPRMVLQQPEKVMRIHDYYMHKLQIYLKLRYPSSAVGGALHTIISTIDKVKNFSDRLRDFFLM